MNLRKVNEEVFVAADPIVRLGDEEIAFLKRQAQANRRGRARICAHRTDDDALHEMLIAISAASYVRPHRHLEKSESFHIVDGEADVVIFDQSGGITDVIELGKAGSGRRFFYRLSEGAFHTLVVRSDVLVVHEVTNGPFTRDRTVLAPFAPPEEEAQRAREYMLQVAELSAQFRRYHPAP